MKRWDEMSNAEKAEDLAGKVKHPASALERGPNFGMTFAALAQTYATLALADAIKEANK